MAEKILVPFELPEPEPVPAVLVEDLSTLEVLLLGHYNLPEQTPREAARDQFTDDAQATLDDLAARFAEAGASVSTRLVFGKDRTTAIDQVMTEEDCAAELNLAPTESVDRILVPVPDVAEFDRLPKFVQVLCEDSTQEVTLLHVVEDDEEHEEGDLIVHETMDGMIEAGFDPDLIDTLVIEGTEHDAEILETATDYNAVVMYEPTAGLGDRIFGSLPDRIVKNTNDPVIVVRRDY